MYTSLAGNDYSNPKYELSHNNYINGYSLHIVCLINMVGYKAINIENTEVPSLHATTTCSSAVEFLMSPKSTEELIITL